MTLLFSPHTDDECLFAGIIAMREQAQIVIVYDGYVQADRGHAVTAEQRRYESIMAARQMGLSEPIFLGVEDRAPNEREVAVRVAEMVRRLAPSRVWGPEFEGGGHDQHNIVADAVGAAFPAALRYLTYTRAGGRSTNGRKIEPGPGMIQRKLRAMACYESQIEIEALGCRPWFTGGIDEYLDG